jgi:MerR family transcriptional regulator, redox-sensitive transcriptional activator SoxR
MRELSIGALARETGLAPSALRYYEKAGLLPGPPRRSGQRRYDERVLGRVELIRHALAAGFTIRETRHFLSGFPAATSPAARWRELAARKLVEVNELIERAQRMKSLLETSFHCRCGQLADCESYLREHRRKAAAPSAPRRGTAARRSRRPASAA